MSIITIIGTLICIPTLIMHSYSFIEFLDFLGDLITTCLPIILPSALAYSS